ncbi:MAG: hypothetical protein ACRDMI_05830 [Streptosporangiaceae bacterium]
MVTGGIVDASTGAAQVIGRYFSVVSVVPSSLYVTFVYLLIASGSWRHSPDWSHAFTSLEHLGIGGFAFLALFSVGLGVFIHPIQFATVQLLEGYWGTGLIAQKIRTQRILHYQARCKNLNRKRNTALNTLADWRNGNVPTTLTSRTPLRSEYDEARRVRSSSFPANLDQVMPTRLGNALRRVESQAGRQYGMDALQVVPHILLIAPASHVDYVNDQRSQLDLAVRMTLISAAASATALLFLWPYRLWALVAVIPYALAYLSYRGSVVAAGHYGAAIDNLINLDRFALYEQLRLPLPPSGHAERIMNQNMRRLLEYHNDVLIDYQHPGGQTPGSSP